MQYQSECRNALESVVNISKSFQKVFMDAMKLFMAIPNRINFLQMGRYGCFSEQTYRNNFENDDFDWFSFNEAIIREHLKGGRKAIAVDPSFIPKSGSKRRGLSISGPVVLLIANVYVFYPVLQIFVDTYACRLLVSCPILDTARCICYS